MRRLLKAPLHLSLCVLLASSIVSVVTTSCTDPVEKAKSEATSEYWEAVTYMEREGPDMIESLATYSNAYNAKDVSEANREMFKEWAYDTKRRIDRMVRDVREAIKDLRSLDIVIRYPPPTPLEATWKADYFAITAAQLILDFEDFEEGE